MIALPSVTTNAASRRNLSHEYVFGRISYQPSAVSSVIPPKGAPRHRADSSSKLTAEGSSWSYWMRVISRNHRVSLPPWC